MNVEIKPGKEIIAEAYGLSFYFRKGKTESDDLYSIQEDYGNGWGRGIGFANENINAVGERIRPLDIARLLQEIENASWQVTEEERLSARWNAVEPPTEEDKLFEILREIYFDMDFQATWIVGL